ncbi:SMAD/FHA domain-containing protein [Gilbertella persicaria]|uniref:SMAD/FHA domain-containing protein n=1 Tax=Gilbertella persicaria TaxID=101096 RepID=UPI002220D78B|nr:SMAD/FHA domain-containing protein [Gilbertella persicaria]KAI8059084.1 SMAD/FHA domain-containing protein [Gilbertella persicaria]
MTSNNSHLQSLRIVPHLDSSNALVFPIMEYSLHNSHVLKVGRAIADRRPSSTSMTFRSKVVSRKHAEIFVEDGKVYIRDMQSSSGTFLNNRRLCGPNQLSQPFELHDNDIIQLGVDYQGGTQEVYRCVKMRVELNKSSQQNDNINQYNLKTYQSLRHLTTPPQNNYKALDPMEIDNDDEDIHVDECCICLFAIAPFQALFVAPCSHTFHYKCLRPLLVNHPGFLCPLCRNYADLESNVSVEVEDVKKMLKSKKATQERKDDLIL